MIKIQGDDSGCKDRRSRGCGSGEDQRGLPGETESAVSGVLNGSFMFMSDLLKKIDFNCEISFVKLSSYCGTSSSGDVKCLIGLGNNIEGRDVIIVEDIVDTGASIEHMVEELKTKKPASIRVCTLSSNRKHTSARFRSIIRPCTSATSLSWDTGWTTTSWAGITRMFTW